MLAKEKAEQLVNTMLDKLYNNGSLSFKRILYERAVECAIVLADEILHQYATLTADLINSTHVIEKVAFWQSVRGEIILLKFTG